jgi:hypothetical protein
MGIIAICFGVAALGLCLGAFGFLFKGRVGNAVVFGIAAFVMAAIAGGAAAIGD